MPWSSRGGMTRSPRAAEGGDHCRDTPRTPCSSHRETPTIHPSSLAKLKASYPWDSSRPFPKTSPQARGPYGEGEEGGKGEGAYLGPVVSANRRGSPCARCSSSTGKHSPACFYVS